MSPIERNNQLKVLVSDEEKEWLSTMADADGVSASDFVRTLIRRAWQSRHLAGPSPLDVLSAPTQSSHKNNKKK